MVGNADGSAWSDLTKPVTGVPIAAGAVDRLLEYERDGMPSTFAWVKPIDATPWLMAIEFPRAVVLDAGRSPRAPPDGDRLHAAADGRRLRLGDQPAHHARRCAGSPRPRKKWPNRATSRRSRSTARTRSAGWRTRSTPWPGASNSASADLEQRVEARTAELARREPRARGVQLLGLARPARAAARHRRLRADPRGRPRRKSLDAEARRYARPRQGRTRRGWDS